MNTNLLLVVLISWIGALGIPACALVYFRHARLQQPPIGVFNSHDLMAISIGIVVIPLIYLVIPSLLLTILLALVFANVISQGFRALLPGWIAWALTLGLIGANILTALSIRAGWNAGISVHWITNDVIVFLAAVIAANFSAQLGMRLHHLAVLILFLACYDGVFAWVIPVTPLLVTYVAGTAFDPVFGFSIEKVQSFFGMGDLFTFALVATVAYKGFGIRGILVSFVLIVCFGVLLPTFGFPFFATLLGWGPLTLVPVQVFFGPAVCLASYWLSRRTKERNMSWWLALG